ncbi:hypothetical protein ACJJTC_003808 [Scirpophaga incertulas]
MSQQKVESDPNVSAADSQFLEENGVEKNGEETKLNDIAKEYISELLSEKRKLDCDKFPMVGKLIDQEVLKVQTTGKAPVQSNTYQDVLHDKPVKVNVKVMVPIKEFPKFNFVGKLLGPKGNTIKQLQENTMCRMAVLGRGSMRDKQKEEFLRNSTDPKFAHLSEDLHIELSALASPSEAHARIAYALAEVKKLLIPDNDVRLPNLMDRMPMPPPIGRPMMRMPPPPPMMCPMPPKVMSLLDRTRASMMETSYYNDQYDSMPEPPRRESVQREPLVREPRASDSDFYYDREGYYEDDQYYKDDPAPAREFQQASVREVGTRRPAAGQVQRFARTVTFTRRSPYARPAK